MRALIGRLLWWFLDGVDGADDGLTHRLRRHTDVEERRATRGRIARGESPYVRPDDPPDIAWGPFKMRKLP